MKFRRPAAAILAGVLLGGGLSAIASPAQAAPAPIRLKVDGGKDGTVPRVSKVKPPKGSENPWEVKSVVRGTSVTNVDIVAGVQVYAQIRVTTNGGKSWQASGPAESVRSSKIDQALAAVEGVALPGKWQYATFYTVDAVPTPAASKSGVRPARQSSRGPIVWLSTPALTGDTKGGWGSGNGGGGGWGGAATPSITSGLPAGCHSKITEVTGISAKGADLGRGTAYIDCPERAGKAAYKMPSLTPRVYMCNLPGDWRNRCPHWVEIALLPGKAGLKGNSIDAPGRQKLAIEVNWHQTTGFWTYKFEVQGGIVVYPNGADPKGKHQVFQAPRPFVLKNLSTTDWHNLNKNMV